MEIREVGEDDLADLLPLMADYCAFYEAAPPADQLMALARALILDPEREGVQLIARDGEGGAAIGFATLYWSWSTTRAMRIAVMNDLYVAPDARSGGVGRALIDACAERARVAGAGVLEWQTAPDNAAAQRVYDATGASRSEWVTYDLPL
jgi:GNAT superfamily N-acetyltransferase